MKHLTDAPFAAFFVAVFLAYIATALSTPAPASQLQEANQPSSFFQN